MHDAQPTSARQERSHARAATPWRAIAIASAHLLALWAFAVAQPVYDLLRRHGEFFIAHRAQPLDLLLFVATVSVAVPLALVLPYAAVARLSQRAGHILLIGFVFLLTTALGSQMLAHRTALPTLAHFGVAAIAGAAVAWLYATREATRTFMTMLSVSVVVFPAIFLMHPSMSVFMRPDTRAADTAATIPDSAPPIVFLIFDQLPLTSLMDANGQIDRIHFPGFGKLADNATWYRNASTVAELTGWALPPIVSGMRPLPERVPTTKSYPHNLFTWLGGRYRMESQEPITQLCPDWLCDANRLPRPVRLAGMTADSSVVYLSAALPEGLRAYLPPLTENWKDFIHNQRWQRRWVTERDDDRREVPRSLIASISRDDPQPTLYFAHSLLPHEPYVYLRSGQAFTRNPRLAGIAQAGRWSKDEMGVTTAYRRHLLQVEFVDDLVSQLVDRLKSEGLYDQALIVVTSDHGVSFRPGQPQKGLNGETVPDIAAVPLLIKAPGQKHAVVDDSNVESVDVLPTIASLIDVPLTWTTDGSAITPGRTERPLKTVRHSGAREQLSIEAPVFYKLRDAAVARKIALFGDGPGWGTTAVRNRELIGRRVEALEVTDGPWEGLVLNLAEILAVDPAGESLPAMLSGRIRDAEGVLVDADVAVAVNGVVAAVTRTYSLEGLRGTWEALVNPALFTKGRNEVGIYVLDSDSARLHMVYSSRERPEELNLSSRGAEEFWAVAQSGFYPREGAPIPYRWTSGEGVLVVPLVAEHAPRSLRLGLTGIGKGGTSVSVSFNGCELFAGKVEAAPWYQTFSLGGCPPATLSQSHGRIVIKSPTWVGGGDTRPRGVAVETVNLFSESWLAARRDDTGTRGSMALVDERGASHASGTYVSVVVGNTGRSIWRRAAETPTPGQPVEIALRWRRAVDRGAMAEQRLQLPHTLYPTDRVVIDAPLVPPDALRADGPWKVTIAPIEQDGTPVPVDKELVVDVTAERR